jgi:iron complex outermembrane receptor protein
VARNSYYGFYLSNVVELTEAIAISASARFNIAKLGLQDKIGTALDGQHRFSRFNPAIGVTAKIVPEATL